MIKNIFIPLNKNKITLFFKLFFGFAIIFLTLPFILIGLFLVARECIVASYQEIDFVGMSRNQVLCYVAKNCDRVLDNDIPVCIASPNKTRTDNWRYCKTIDDLLKDSYIIQSKYLGVNYKSRMGVFSYQELEFNDKDVVITQKEIHYFDAL